MLEWLRVQIALHVRSFIYLWQQRMSRKAMVLCRKNVHEIKLSHSPFDAHVLYIEMQVHLPYV